MKTPKTPPAVSSAFNLNFSENDLSENEMLRHSDSSHLLTNDPTQYSPICQLPLFVSVLPVLSQAKCLSQIRDWSIIFNILQFESAAIFHTQARPFTNHSSSEVPQRRIVKTLCRQTVALNEMPVFRCGMPKIFLDGKVSERFGSKNVLLIC